MAININIYKINKTLLNIYVDFLRILITNIEDPIKQMDKPIPLINLYLRDWVLVVSAYKTKLIH